MGRLETVVFFGAGGRQELAGSWCRSWFVEPATHVIERAVFEHDNDNVFDLREYGHDETLC